LNEDNDKKVWVGKGNRTREGKGLNEERKRGREGGREVAREEGRGEESEPFWS